MKIKFGLCVLMLSAMTMNGYSSLVASNLGNSQDWEEYTYAPEGPDDVAYLGNTFTTGSNAEGYTITSITLQFGESYNSGGIFELYLCPDSASAPDSTQITLVGSASPSLNSLETFIMPGEGYDVEADTTYWIVGASDVEGFAWVSTEDSSVSNPSSDTWSFGTTTYINSPDYSVGGAPGGTPTKQMFSIDAEPIPEPATLGLISLVGIGALASKRFFF